jgi:hypothetical protein
MHNGLQNTTQFLALQHAGGIFTKHPRIEDASFWSWIVFEFAGSAFGEDVARQLTALDCVHELLDSFLCFCQFCRSSLDYLLLFCPLA